MRWKIKAPPKQGDWRYRHKFAFFPTQVENYMVWLETFYIKERYIEVGVFDEGNIHCEMQWVEYDRGLLYSY